jgi:hypothetical protein
VLALGNEDWVFKKAVEERLAAWEMKFKGRTAGYILLLHKRSEDFL